MALSSSLVSLGILVGIYSLLALGLNIKYGYTGLLEIGHVAFFLIGAHVTALLMLPPAEGRALVDYVLGWGWSWFPSVIVAAVVAGVVGGFVALPAVRLREDYLAIAVLGLSVILQFVVRNEQWLANGTDGLYGIGRPFEGVFPMPASAEGANAEAAIVLGATVAVLWASAAYAVVLINEKGDVGRAKNAVMYASTLGAGYMARRLAGDGKKKRRFRASVATSAIAGAVAAAGGFLGAQHLVLLVFFGGFSVFTWTFAAVALSHHYTDLTRGDFSAGIGIAVGLVVAISPLVVLGGNSAGSSLAVVLLVSFVYGTYRLARFWKTGFVRVVGVAAASLFLLRYFVIEGFRVYERGGTSRVATETTENILWMLRFDGSSLPSLFAPGAVEFGYSRFLLVLTLALVAGSYYLAEMTARSPFGRVLKAVREDEDVANALGKNVFSYKVQSMMLGSALAGVAGGLFAIYLRSFSYSDFAPEVTFIVFLIVIVGGTANNAGVVLGSALYWGFERATQDIAGFFPAEQATQVAALRRALIGVLLIFVLYYMPQGVWKERKGTYGGRNVSAEREGGEKRA